MTSPDERFDDAFLPRQYEVYDFERHEYRIGIGVWPAVCHHCGFAGSLSHGIHPCGMAVVDMIWMLPEPRDAATVERLYRWAAQVQELTEEEAAERIKRRRPSEAEFWNRMF